MPYTILIFAYRKQSITPAEFLTHYETTHIPLIKSLAGPLFPISHTRTYLQRTEISSPTNNDPTNNKNENERNARYPATVMIGTQADFDYDAFAELKFKDQAAFGEFFGCVTLAENAEKIAADEEKFLDRNRMTVVVVGETHVTLGE